MSKGLKRVVAVAAAIAIPFAAPWLIAKSAFLTTVAGTIGTTATSTLVGAGLGAVKGAALGEDIGQSALQGGIGGGVGGFQAARSAQALQTAQAGAARQTLANASQLPGAGVGTVLSNPGLNIPGAAAPVGAGTVLRVGAQGVAQAPATFAEALRQVPSAVAAKFRDPAMMADLTLRAGGMLAGSLAAGDGLNSEERKLLAAQTEELRRAQTENVGLFNQRLQQAQELAGSAKYFDPEYFGLQTARRAQVTGARAKQAGLRGLTGAQRTAEARRFDLATGRDTGTAFDTGYSTGVQGRVQAQQAGLAAMPKQFPTSDAGYSSLYAAYGDANTRRTQQASDIGALFAPFGERDEDGRQQLRT